MSTTTTAETTPNPPEVKAAPISLTPNAIAKVKGIMAQQNPAPAGLRVGGWEGVLGLLLLPAVRHQRGHDGQSVRYGRPKSIRGRHLDHVPERLPRGLRRDAGGCRFQVREPEREEHLRLRVVVQRLIRLARKLRKPRRRTRLFSCLRFFHWPLDLRRKGRRDCQAPQKRAPS